MQKKNDGAPKSMVIRIGAQEVGGAVSQLVQDVRHVMEPDTAVRLKVCIPLDLLRTELSY